VLTSLKAKCVLVLKKFFSGEEMSYRAVFSLLLPVVVDQFFLIGFNFINTAMISSSGAAAISAVNIVGSLNILLVQLFTSIALGGTVLIAQYYGRRNYKMIGNVVNGGIYATVLVATTAAILFMILHNVVLGLLFGAASPAVIAGARIYMTGILFSYVGESLIEGINGCLRGIDRTKVSLQLSLLMNTVYLLFNFLFVTYLHLGVFGLTLSLNISRYSIAILAVWTLFRNRALFGLKFKTLRHVNWGQTKRVLKVSVPFAAESTFFNGGKIIMQMMIVTLGTAMIAANAIASSWIQLSEIIPNALSVALVPIVGQCIGRNNIGDAKKLTKSFLGLGTIAFLVVDLGLLPLFSMGMRLFNPAPATIPIIFHIYLVIIVMHAVFWSSSFVLPAALRAAGDAKFTTVVSLISMWSFRIGVGYLVGIVLGYGIFGIFVVMSCEWAIRSTVYLHRFRGNRWYRNKLI